MKEIHEKYSNGYYYNNLLFTHYYSVVMLFAYNILIFTLMTPVITSITAIKLSLRLFLLHLIL